MSGVQGPTRKPRTRDLIKLCGLENTEELLGRVPNDEEIDMVWNTLPKEFETWGSGIKGPMQGLDTFRLRKRSGRWYSIPMGDWDLWSTARAADDVDPNKESCRIEDSWGWLWPSDGTRAGRGVAIFRHCTGAEGAVMIDLCGRQVYGEVKSVEKVRMAFSVQTELSRRVAYQDIFDRYECTRFWMVLSELGFDCSQCPGLGIWSVSVMAKEKDVVKISRMLVEGLQICVSGVVIRDPILVEGRYDNSNEFTGWLASRLTSVQGVTCWRSTVIECASKTRLGMWAVHGRKPSLQSGQSPPMSFLRLDEAVHVLDGDHGVTIRAVRPHVWDAVEFPEGRRQIKTDKEPTSFVLTVSKLDDGMPKGHVRWSMDRIRDEKVLLRAFVREGGGYFVNVTKYEVRKDPSVKDKEPVSLYDAAGAWQWSHAVGGVVGLAAAIMYIWQFEGDESTFTFLAIMLVGFLKEETCDALIFIGLRMTFKMRLPDDWASGYAHAVLTLLVGSVEPLGVLGRLATRCVALLSLCWLLVTTTLCLRGKRLVDAVQNVGYEREDELHELLGKALSCGNVEAPRTRSGDRGVNHLSPYTLAGERWEDKLGRGHLTQRSYKCALFGNNLCG